MCIRDRGAAPPAAASAPAPAPAPAAASAQAENGRSAEEAKAEGTAAFKAGDYGRAAKLYYEATHKKPDDHTLFSNLSLIHISEPTRPY